MKIKKLLWLLLGFLGLALGAIGAVIPLMPSFPFLLLAALSFAKSSERLHDWFINTSLYKKNLESYVQGRGMSRSAKRRVMCSVSLVMAISCIVMLLRAVYYPCIILFGVWLFHILYFRFRVKTLPPEAEADLEEA